MRAPLSTQGYLLLSLFFFITFILFKSWVSEDAYITARVLDNAINGFGLTWNITERVQVYTHPLWLLTHLPFYAITQEFFYTTLFISWVCILFTLRTLYAYQSNALTFILFIIIPLICSRAVSDYMTSGLESPLSFLLLALFVHSIIKEKKSWFTIGLISCLLILNRFDNLLLIAPTLCYLLWISRTVIPWLRFSISFLPLGGWCLFSLLYYGFILPNTRYAKLENGLDLHTQLSKGLDYLTNFITHDLGSFLLFLIITLATTIYLNTKRGLFISLLLGAVSYSIYVISIGGDYMMGRMFASPIFLCIIIGYYGFSHKWHYTLKTSLILLCLILCTLLSQAIIMSGSNVLTRPFDAAYFIEPRTKIHDERGWSWDTNHLIRGTWLNRNSNVTAHNFAQKGLEFKQRAGSCATPICYTRQYFAIGMTGYFSGPYVHIIDIFAIADAFLARLPVQKNDGTNTWAGHYYRHPPPAYPMMIQEQKTDHLPENIARYYHVLKTIISGELWSSKRIYTIFDINLGRFDHLLPRTWPLTEQ